MFPFWQDVVAPILEAAGARRIVEVGALRGENTERMLERLGRDAELHVIDPQPDFDPDEHVAKFPGRYVFYRDLSVNVLGELPAMDAALLDGDHNWYTVHTELQLLAAGAREAGAPLPVTILHDVGWPYGRRDLYYEPSNIPDEHRHAWRRLGIRPGREQLMPGGMNTTLANAELEGGPRNGVMTAVEDFVAEHDRPLRLVVLPLYFGLAILVEEQRLAERPDLAAVLDWLESAEGKDTLLRLGESIRLDAAIFDQALLRQRDDRVDALAERYLDSVKRGIVNDHHIENEVLIHHLRTTLARGGQPNADVLRDPARNSAANLRQIQQRHRTGERLPLQTETRSERVVEDAGLTRQGFATSGRVGLDHLQEGLDTVWAGLVRGDLLVCGVGFAGPAVLMAAYLQARDFDHRQAQRRKLWIVDRFRASDGHADLNQTRDALDRFGLLDDRVRFLQGDPVEALRDVTAKGLALVYIGPGLGTDVAPVLEQSYARLMEGGVIMFEDAVEAHAQEAITDYRRARGITAPTERIGRVGMHWVKEEPFGEPVASESAPVVGASRSPLAKRARLSCPRSLGGDRRAQHASGSAAVAARALTALSARCG